MDRKILTFNLSAHHFLFVHMCVRNICDMRLQQWGEIKRIVGRFTSDRVADRVADLHQISYQQVY